VTELAVWSGSDFVLLDCEHSIVDEALQLASLQVISNTDAFAVVRVRPGDLTAVGRYLDLGADGILMPNIRTVADVAAFVAAATYGPAGTRSSTGGAVRAGRYGLRTEAVPAPLLLVIIETAAAVANIRAIAQTPGLEGLVIGPYDLAADLNCAQDFTAERYAAAFAAIEGAAKESGLLLGTIAHPGYAIDALIARGHRFLISSLDTLALRDGFQAHLAAARGGRS